MTDEMDHLDTGRRGLWGCWLILAAVLAIVLIKFVRGF